MKFVLVLVIALQGFLFAQDSPRHVNLNMPILYEEEPVVDSPVQGEKKGKGFNYQLFFACVGYAAALYDVDRFFHWDDKAADYASYHPFDSRLSYEANRKDIVDAQDNRDASVFWGTIFFTGATYFIIRYIFSD